MDTNRKSSNPKGNSVNSSKVNDGSSLHQQVTPKTEKKFNSLKRLLRKS